MLYDGIFKELMNPETAPENLNEVLSLLLGKKVEIIEVMPGDNSRLGSESSLLVMDIVVRLEDGSIANIEIQRQGFYFPGERSACYSADLLLRQYKRVRSRLEQENTKRFSYRDIKNVYVIVFYEISPKEFHDFQGTYIHFFHQISDSGLRLPLLQNYYFIPLDIFKKNMHNTGIQNRLDGWLSFLSSDDPQDILALLERYPDFKALYEHAYRICRNTEYIMGIFSDELRMLDENTVQYMIDEMQETINNQQKTLIEKDNIIAEKNNALLEKDNALAKKDNVIAEKDKIIAEMTESLKKLESPGK